MGKSDFSSRVEAEAHVIARQSRTGDESNGYTWHLVVLDDFTCTLHQVVPL